MSTFRNPVGPQPSSTYWRRRLVVGLALLAVIIVIVMIVVDPGGNTPTSDAQDNPTSTSTSTADPTADAEAPAADTACAPAVVSVAAVTDASEYAAGQQPLLSLSVTNTGTTACTISAGTDVQEYVITSGEDRIWSSKDCQVDAVALPTTLEPGVAVTTTPFPWDRTRSDPTTCDATNPTAVTAGGATYRLSVSINGIESAESKPFLLN